MAPSSHPTLLWTTCSSTAVCCEGDHNAPGQPPADFQGLALCCASASCTSCSAHSMSQNLQHRRACIIGQLIFGCSPLGTESSRCQLSIVNRQTCCQPEPTQHEAGEACSSNTAYKGLNGHQLGCIANALEVEASGTAPACSSPASAVTPAVLQSLRPEIKQIPSDGQPGTAYALFTKQESACRTASLPSH